MPAKKLSRSDVTSWQDTNFKDFKTPGINGDFGFSSITQVPLKIFQFRFHTLCLCGLLNNYIAKIWFKIHFQDFACLQISIFPKFEALS